MAAKVSYLVLVFLLINATHTVCLASYDLMQKDCLNLYSFENDLNAPKNANNWNISNSRYHTGAKSLQSTGQTKSEYSIEETGPASISFWWDSNKGDDDFFFYQMDHGSILPYTGTGWQKVTPDSIPEGKHTLTWIFSKRQDKNTSGWIDDLSIIKSTCDQNLSEISTQTRIRENASESNINMSIPLIESQKEPDVNVKEIKSIQGEILTKISNIDRRIDEIACVNDTVYVKKIHVDSTNYTFRSISEAILHVKPFGTIKVDSGEYDGQLSIDKPLRLKGINKECTSIRSDKTVIYINSSYVQIEGFTIIGGKHSKYGILQICSSNCSINNNNIKNCDQGIALGLSNNSKIYENNITDSSKGIFIDNSSDNSVYLNKIISNKKNKGIIGLCLKNSSCNLISDNDMNGFEDGIKIFGMSLINLFNNKNMIKNSVGCDINIENEYIYKSNIFQGEFNITKKNGCIHMFKRNPILGKAKS